MLMFTIGFIPGDEQYQWLRPRLIPKVGRPAKEPQPQITLNNKLQLQFNVIHKEEVIPFPSLHDFSLITCNLSSNCSNIRHQIMICLRQLDPIKLDAQSLEQFL